MKETFGNQETQLCSLHNSITIKSKKFVLLGGMVLFRCLSVFLFGFFRVLVGSRRDNTVFIFQKHMTNRSQLFLSIKIS